MDESLYKIWWIYGQQSPIGDCCDCSDYYMCGIGITLKSDSAADGVFEAENTYLIYSSCRVMPRVVQRQSNISMEGI